MVNVRTYSKVRILFVCFFIFLYVTTNPASAKNIDISFEVKLTDTSPGEIKTIVQDKYGFMWFGCRNAVLKFNGYEYDSIKYQEEINGKIELSSPFYTTKLFEDRDGTLWITSHSGFFRYDREINRFLKPKPVNQEDTAFFDRTLQDVAQLPTGELIVGGDGAGFVIYDAKENKIVWRQSTNSVLSIQKFLIDSKNRVWFSNSLGLNLFNPESKESELFIPNAKLPDSKADNALITLLEDSQGNILGGTLGKGLYSFDTNTKQFTRYLHDAGNPRSIPDNTIWGLIEDSKGIVWVGHDQTTFSWFDPKRGEFRHYASQSGQPGTLAYSAIRSIYEDRNGDVWIGHYPGKVSFHDRSTSAIQVYRTKPGDLNTINSANVFSIMEDDKGNFWMAVGGMVEYFDRKAHTFKRYNAADKNYSAHGTLSGFIDSQGHVYIGTWTEGYHIYNAELDRFEAQKINPELANDESRESDVLTDATIWNFCETSDGSIWIGTHYAGISRYQKESGTFKRYKSGGTAQNIANNIAWDCMEDSKGRFWVGTAWGASIIDYESDTVQTYHPSKGKAGALQGGSISSIFEDSKGQIWLGSNEGLHLYDDVENSFTVFTSNDGLSHNSIRAITEDNEGNLWLGTEKGITRFNIETRETKQFLSHNGIPFGGVNREAVLTTKKGEIVFGTVNELVIINPEQLRINKTPPDVVLSEFKLFAKPVTINGPDKLLSKSINQTSEIVLDYTQIMISFEFAALSYRSPEKNLYAYKLDGFDQDWREIRNQREAQYTNLSAGKYTFMVKASNNDEVWNNTPKTITVIQLPPPWKTWWAYSIYVAMVFFALAYFVQYQRNKRRQVEIQNRVLEEKVAKRTASLAEKNRDIQTMLSNMRQGLFTIDQGLTIHPQYSEYLKNIYEQENIAGENAFNFLFKNAQISNDRLHQIEASISSIIGMDTMNYKFNGHLLIREYSTVVNNKNKVLDLDWDPIVEEDTVIKLMVSVRDVTELKAVEYEAEEKKRELQIIGHLINTKSSKYLNFNQSAHRYLKECQTIIDSISIGNEQHIRSLYRAMHTIKGNSRMLSFSFIADLAHDAENRYASILAGEERWETSVLLADLAKIRETVDLYYSLYRTVLGRDDEKSRESDGAWFDGKTLLKLLSNLKQIESDYPEIYRSIEKLVSEKTTLTLAEVLQDNVRALASIAKELHKEPPKVVIEDNGLRVTEKAQGLLIDIFSHLFRNSIDHGIESPEKRIEAQKDIRGLISVKAGYEKDTVYIHIIDDGAGLDIDALYKKGINENLWTLEQPIKVSQIASSIFKSGTTTKENVSDISGRGVGLDAVKQFVTKAGGEILIENDVLEEVYDPQKMLGRVNFCFKLTFPRNLFV